MSSAVSASHVHHSLPVIVVSKPTKYEKEKECLKTLTADKGKGVSNLTNYEQEKEAGLEALTVDKGKGD